jgi:hypothetical protein
VTGTGELTGCGGQEPGPHGPVRPPGGLRAAVVRLGKRKASESDSESEKRPSQTRKAKSVRVRLEGTVARGELLAV